MYSLLEQAEAWRWLWGNPQSSVAIELRRLEAKLFDDKDLTDPVALAAVRNQLLGMRRVAQLVANGAAEQLSEHSEDLGPSPLRRRTPFLTTPIGG